MTVAQQMFSAEVLKLRRNRGLVAFAPTSRGQCRIQFSKL